MKNLEEISAKLKQFIEDNMQELIKLDETLEQQEAQLLAKEEEIEDVKLQLEYMAMLICQLENKLEVLLEEKNMLIELIEESKAMRQKKDLCECEQEEEGK
jgi:hypothetical protein